MNQPIGTANDGGRYRCQDRGGLTKRTMIRPGRSGSYLKLPFAVVSRQRVARWQGYRRRSTGGSRLSSHMCGLTTLASLSLFCFLLLSFFSPLSPSLISFTSLSGLHTNVRSMLAQRKYTSMCRVWICISTDRQQNLEENKRERERKRKKFFEDNKTEIILDKIVSSS